MRGSRCDSETWGLTDLLDRLIRRQAATDRPARSPERWGCLGDKGIVSPSAFASCGGGPARRARLLHGETSASCIDRQAAQIDVLVDQLRGVDSNPVADEVHGRPQLTIRLGILRIAAAVEADRRAYDAILQVETQERAAFGSATEDEAIPAGRETH